MGILYQVSKNTATIMSFPNKISKVLGILHLDDKIDIINIINNWCYFKYNNTDAYVEQTYLKLVNTPIEIKGSITIKYLDKDTSLELRSSETINNLTLGSHSYYFKEIYSYKVTNSVPKLVTLTTADPNQEIIFYYEKIIGCISIKYINKINGTEIYESTTINNLELGSYSYSSIEIYGYLLDGNEIQFVTLTENEPNAIITFTYTEILGSVTIKYLDSDSLETLLTSKSFTDLKLGNYTYSAPDIDGYNISSLNKLSVTLTDTNPTQEISFLYSKILGSVTIKYVDSSTLAEIAPAEIFSNIELSTYSYNAKTIDGYNLTGDSSIRVKLTNTNPDVTVSFSYNKILGSITINYLDESTLLELSPSTTFSNLDLRSYTYNAIYINKYELSGDSSISITLTSNEPDKTITYMYRKIEIPNDLNLNEVPYISTYYFKPIVRPDEEVFIDYYITDYYQKEYINEDYSETFTVIVRIEGQQEKLYPNLNAGDHTVSLGTFSVEEEVKFSILCSDKYGRNSHELFNFFLVQGDVVIKEYIMTKDDLVNYNIKNSDDYEEKIYVKVDKLTDVTTGTKIEEVANATIIPSKKYVCFIGTTEKDENENPIMQSKAAKFWLNTLVKYAADYDENQVLQESTNTRIGLQKLLTDKKSEGYNKLLLLSGTYRIDHNGTIYIPSEFTLDLNNATIKQNQFTGSNSLMISLDETFNSHVINGTIEGDYFSHDYTNSQNNSEWPTGISISGYSRYSSFDNITIKDITGYGGGNGLSLKSGYFYFAKSLGDAFSLGDIDTTNGEIINSTTRQSTDFINISQYVNFEYISINRYLGYQGMSSGSWNLLLHFYDNTKKYIKTINSFQYRKTKIPPNTNYLKITILSNVVSKDLWMTYFKTPCHCSLKNIKFNNCRCVGLAQSAMNNMLVDNCEWTLTGQSGAFCAYDAEDGWDLMQDVTLRNLNFYNNYRNNFLTCAGHNFSIENMINGNIHIWPRTNSYIIKNCTNLSGAYLGRSSRELTGYVRFDNNVIKDNMKIAGERNFNWGISVKDCIINGKIECILGLDSFIRCNIGGNLTSNESIPNAIGGKFIDCYIYNRITSHNSGGEYHDCTIENLSGAIRGTHNYFNCKFINYKETPVDSSIINMYNCTLVNTLLTLSYWQQGATISINSCNIDNSSYFLRLPHYSMKKPITLTNNSIISSSASGLIIFYDDRTGGSAGELVSQNILQINANTITLPNSHYIISGLSSTTINNINIKFVDNIITPNSTLLCDPTAYQNPNINIQE